MRWAWLLVAVGLWATPLLAGAPAAPLRIESESVLGGQHSRLMTPHGPVHVWRPAGYDTRTAGTVVYVHGYYASVDETWAKDNLPAQFRDSGLNALFVAPEAPASRDEPVRWSSLTALLRTVRAQMGVPRSTGSVGPVVVAGHSAGFRTIERWLPERAIHQIILLDALYGRPQPFRSWLRAGAARRRMILVAGETLGPSLRVVSGFRSVARKDSIPEDESGFTRRERQARILVLRSQYEHMDLVTSGKVIPVLLRLSGLLRETTPRRSR